MSTAERRSEIAKLLCRRRHETISNLASQFSVSERTIRRDIEALSLLSVPLYTQSGRYGGVYVMDGYTMERMYMQDKELYVLQKLFLEAERRCILSAEELGTLQSVIALYTKPICQSGRKEKINENTGKGAVPGALCI